MVRRRGVVALAMLVVTLVGCGGDDGGSGSDGAADRGGGGSGGEAAASAVPINSDERCPKTGPAPGCFGEPAPPGIVFEEPQEQVLITYSSGTVTAAPSDDPVNNTTYTATLVFELANGGDSPLAADEWEVTASVAGTTLRATSGCEVAPTDAQVAPGEAVDVTHTCTIDLKSDGTVNPEAWGIRIEGQRLGDYALLAVEAG